MVLLRPGRDWLTSLRFFGGSEKKTGRFEIQTIDGILLKNDNANVLFSSTICIIFFFWGGGGGGNKSFH